MSRRARGVPVWATLAWLGRQRRGCARPAARGQRRSPRAGSRRAARGDHPERCGVHAGLPGAGRRREIAPLAAALRADGSVFASPSRWRDRAVLRFSVSNWATDEIAVARTIAPSHRAHFDQPSVARSEGPSRRAAAKPRCAGRGPAQPAQLTGPVHFSPGPLPISSGMGEASRKASCSERSPSRRLRACWSPMCGALGRDEPGEGVDQLARLVQVGLRRGVVGEPALDGGGAHEVHCSGGDDLDSRDVRDVSRGLVDVRVGVLRGVTVAH